MKDRIVEHPNRYQLSLVDGTTDTYDLSAVTGTVTEVGTALNKANLLSDDVCSALNIPTTSVPNDALFVLSIGNNRALVVVTVYETSTTTPIPNVLVDGIRTSSGADVYTDSNGIAIGFTYTTTTTISVNAEYVDLTVSSSSISTPFGQKINATIYATRRSNVGYLETTVSSAGYYRFTDKVLVDVHLVGGGYNGSAGFCDTAFARQYGGTGGAGGYQNYSTNISPNPKTRYQAIIGAGNGGASTFMGLNSAQYSGGSGGSGGGDGSTVSSGGTCTVKKYGTGSVVASGGGGGGNPYGSGGSGGSPYGGTGASNSGVGGNATGYGGGGGGGSTNYPNGTSGGNGYQGVIWFRWRYSA